MCMSEVEEEYYEIPGKCFLLCDMKDWKFAKETPTCTSCFVVVLVLATNFYAVRAVSKRSGHSRLCCCCRTVEHTEGEERVNKV